MIRPASPALFILLCACGQPTPIAAGAPDLGIPDVSFEQHPDLAVATLGLRCNPNMVVSALVDVAAEADASEVSIEFGDTSAYGQSTPRLSVPASKIVPIFGITPGGTTHARVHAFSSGTEVSVSEDLSVRCERLPMDFPSFSVKTDRGGAAQYFLVSVSNDLHSAGYGVVVDRGGRVIWYHPMGPFSMRANDFALEAPGVFVLYQIRGVRFVEVNLLGEELPTPWSSTSGPLGADGHDVAFLGNGSALVLGFENHDVDTTALGGGPHTNLRSATLDVVSPTGTHLSHWSTNDNVALEEFDPRNSYAGLQSGDQLDPMFVDFPHANGVSLPNDGSDGSAGVALLGFYYTNSLYKIDLGTGSVLARIGGAASDYVVIGDPLGGFDHQHCAHILPNGHLLLFDNGLDRDPPRPRAAEYRMDDTTKPKSLNWVWDYSLPDGVSTAGGSVARLSNGNTVIGWPDEGLIDEVNAKGELLLELSSSWTTLYRAVPLPLEMTSIYK